MRELNKAERCTIWGGDAQLMPIQYTTSDGTKVAENRAPSAHEQSIISSFNPANPFASTTQGKMGQNTVDVLPEFYGTSTVDSHYTFSEEYLPDGSAGNFVVSGDASTGYFLYAEETPGMQQWLQQHPEVSPDNITDPSHTYANTVEGQPGVEVWFGDNNDSGDDYNYGEGGLDYGKWS